VKRTGEQAVGSVAPPGLRSRSGCSPRAGALGYSQTSLRDWGPQTALRDWGPQTALRDWGDTGQGSECGCAWDLGGTPTGTASSEDDGNG
jgi:hypothetical protein